MKDLAKRIEEITKKNSLTGKELGEKLGLKKTPITDWKNGKAKPTLEQIIKICDIFAISSDELLQINEKKKLTDEEQLLLEHFRKCSNGNKQIILNAASGLSNQELELKEPEQEIKSSTLKIG